MDIVNKFYSSLHSNKIISTILTLFLILYGGMASPRLPGFIKELFQNSIFKIVVLSLVVYSSNRDPKFAILMAVVFSVTLTMVDQQKIFENFPEDGTMSVTEDKVKCPTNEDDFDNIPLKENNWKECCCKDAKGEDFPLSLECIKMYNKNKENNWINIDEDGANYPEAIKKHVCRKNVQK